MSEAPLSRPRARVVVTQHRLLHYRLGLFERLRAACAARRIELRLVHGGPSPTEALKRDVGSLPWANVVRNRFLRLGGVDLIWQAYPRALRDADLVILMQENRILSNYPWLLRLGVRAGQRVAFWGHGRNLQATAPHGWREDWKRGFVTRVDWWFAYTDSTSAIVRRDGFPAARITVLNNAIDDERFARDLAMVSAAQLSTCRARLGATPEALVGVYCGSLYPDKRLPLLLAAADLVHAERPEFRLAVLGDGPSRPLVLQAAATRPWLQAVGAQRGIDKAAWFRASHLCLNPGAVGLQVLDAFCAGLPLITTAPARHGPELAYLVSDRNSLVTADDARSYADAVLRLARDPALRDRLRAAAADDAQRYTLAAMVERFVAGIEGCLAAPSGRRWRDVPPLAGTVI